MTTTIKCNSLNEGYQFLLKELIAKGNHSIGAQQGVIKELLNYELELSDPRKSVLSLPIRNMSRRYAAGEFLLYMSGTDDVEAFAHYSKAWRDLATPEGKINSAYGERMFGSGKRLQYAINQLRKNSDTKNAVVVIRDERDQREDLKDRCCTMFLQFTIRDRKLDMRTCMRSSDIWLGLPYDVFCFTRIMQYVLYEVNKSYGADEQIKLGTYTHQMLNVHAYPLNYAKIIEYVQDHGYEVIDTDKAYQFPEYDEYAEKELPALLEWEQGLRHDTLFGKEYYATELRNKRFHPFCETLGSWLVNKIKNCSPTAFDIRMFNLADSEATNSKCADRQVGCVIVNRDHEVVGKGCNTVISCNKRCDDKLMRVCNVTHAEVKALSQLSDIDKQGVLTAYVNLYPCLPCRQALNKAGIYDIRVKGFSHKGAGGDTPINLYDPEWIPDNN